MDNYSITVIQEEAVPLAATPNFILNGSQWVLGVICVALIVAGISYLIICWKQKQIIANLKLELGDGTENRCFLNYFSLKEQAQELQYMVIEQKNSNKA